MTGQSIKNPGKLSRNFNNSKNLTTFSLDFQEKFARKRAAQWHGSRFLNREAWSIIDAKY